MKSEELRNSSSSMAVHHSSKMSSIFMGFVEMILHPSRLNSKQIFSIGFLKSAEPKLFPFFISPNLLLNLRNNSFSKAALNYIIVSLFF